MLFDPLAPELPELLVCYPCHRDLGFERSMDNLRPGKNLSITYRRKEFAVAVTLAAVDRVRSASDLASPTISNAKYAQNSAQRKVTEVNRTISRASSEFTRHTPLL